MNATDLYRERLQQHERRITELERSQDRLGTLRIALFATAASLTWWLLFTTTHSPWWLLVPMSAFGVAVVQHGRIRRRALVSQRIAAAYRAGLARLDDAWMGTGRQGERFADPHHVYAADLDLFGRGSLFELLFTGRTRMGEEILRPGCWRLPQWQTFANVSRP